MKKFAIPALFILFAAFALPAQSGAEYYRYVDSSGVVRYTYNLADVPPAQRKGLKAYTEIESSAQQAPAGDKTLPETGETAGLDKQEMPENNDLAEVNKELIREKEALDSLYSELTSKRATLAEDRKEGRISLADYNEQVGALNEKIHEFNTRRDEFNKKVNAYNEKVRKQSDLADKSTP